MSTQIVRGNIRGIFTIAVTLSPSAVGANTTAEQAFTISGIQATDNVIDVTKPTTQAGLGIVNFRVSAANTVAVAFSNNTAGNITPTASESYRMTVIRPENPVLPSVVNL